MALARRFLSLLLLLFLVLLTSAGPLSYDVHWLGGATSIDRDIPSTKQTVDIYCYTGSSKSILALWQTVKFNIKVKNDEFSQYLGSTPEEVFKEYTEDSYGWSVVNPFQKKSYRSVSLELFNSTCMAINTKQKHSIELQVIRIDIWRVLLMFLGVAFIFSSRALSGNPVFFYLCGIFIGVFASFMVLVYYVSKLLPKKTLTYGILIGGWTVGVYILQQVWENIRGILLSYQQHLFWYTLLVGFGSFLVCYRIGPPRNQRSKNLVMWTLQGLGVLMIFLSSEYQEASAALILASLAVKYFPQSLLYRITSYIHRRFPPKPRLLSSEEYYEQGARETKSALDELRKHCASPDCAQWRIMLKLNDSKRFASFIEGDSHLSDDEIVDYESYAFSLERSRKPQRAGNSTANRSRLESSRLEESRLENSRLEPNHLEISDDDSTGSDDEI